MNFKNKLKNSFFKAVFYITKYTNFYLTKYIKVNGLIIVFIIYNQTKNIKTINGDNKKKWNKG